MTRQVFRLSTLLGLALSFGSVWAGQLIGRVVGVADGDTLTVLAQRQQHRVRLTRIDAPEKGQAFGQVSKQHLSDLAYDKTVSVVFRPAGAAVGVPQALNDVRPVRHPCTPVGENSFLASLHTLHGTFFRDNRGVSF